MKKITLAMGNGGEENARLIELIQKHFANELLEKAEDGTLLSKLDFPVMSTDSFTITPLFFKGGDIGKLSIAGSCNDLAMMGAKPRFLSCSFIVEEGFLLKDFERILVSMAAELEKNGAFIVTGDTKVVPKGSCDGLYINVTGIGEQMADVSQRRIEEGDMVLVSGDIARHGASIFAAREGIELESEIESDCQSLWPLVADLLEAVEVKAMRDATRGGVAAVLNEWARAQNLCIEVNEEAVAIDEAIKGICEILGFDPFVLANEGTFVAVVRESESKDALKILKKHNPSAAIIGRVTSTYPARVVLKSPWGTRRFLDMPSGEILPRIC